MKKSKGIISLILTVVLIALLGFTTVVGFGKGQTGAAKNIKLGLDLEGGVSITYQVKGDTPSKEDMSDTIYKLQKRVEQYSTEATVYQEGDNRISIEIPGVTDANEILSELGQPGSLYFIKEKDSDGNPNYGLDTSGHYVLAKSMDELKEEGSVVLTGTDIKSAKSGSYQDSTTGANENVVQLSMTKEGTEKFAEATKAAKEAEETIAIYYDGELISVPRVNAEITDGQAIIEGSMEYEEAEQLASTIRIGGLSVELEEIRSNVVGAQLGEEAISTSLMAGAIGLAIVFVFMCMVYLLPGLASSLALVIYTGLILVLLNAFDITLTLPGIAGIILGIGMAVDANVIIFARVKEELTAGKSVKSALNAGFHKAMSAILDGNITTLIAAAVLWLKGSGTVKGFAQTLALGIVVSMFTALVITRIIIFSLYAIGLRDVKFYAKKFKKERKIIDFLGKKAIFFAISIAVIAVGFVTMGVQSGKGEGALNYSLEFKGGTATTVTFDKDYSIKEIDSKIVPVVEDVTGDHNVSNALSAIATAELLGLSMDTIQKGLLSFSGTDRRFEYKGTIDDVTIVDDYAHHPTEIKATLKAAKHYPHRKLWCVFQPHTYTRTKAFFQEFAEALSHADHVILADIYAARETDTLGVSSEALSDAIRSLGTDSHYFPSFAEIETFLKENWNAGDLVLTMGAGDVVKIGEDLLK